jgi:hypothetical protein
MQSVRRKFTTPPQMHTMLPADDYFCNECARGRWPQMHTMLPADGAPPPRLRTDLSTRAQARP